MATAQIRRYNHHAIWLDHRASAWTLDVNTLLRHLAALRTIALSTGPGLVLALQICVIEVHAQTSLPDLGDSSTTALSPTDEKKLGRDFMRQVRKHLPLIEDTDLNVYLQGLGRRLAIAADMDPNGLEFFLIDDPTLNAFAAPGGFIGVHTGLIMAARDESELAAVLSHELAHISQRHLARLIARSKELSFPAMAAVLAGVLIGGQAGVAALTATNAAVSADSLSYSRNFEREADAIGIRTLSNAGFDPAGMTRFFAQMQRWARVQEIDVPEFLRTHPLTLNRIAEAETRVAGLAPSSMATKDSNFHFIRSSIRARYSRRASQTIDDFKAEIDQFDGGSADTSTTANVVALQYGLAQAQSRISEFAKAKELLTGLLDGAEGDDELAIRLAIARAELDAGDTDSALAKLKQLHQRDVNNLIVVEQYAQALIVARQPALAVEIIEPVVRTRPDSLNLNRLLARAASESRQPLIAHTALADYHYYRDELSLALDQLYAAREFSKDNDYQSARIEARIDQYQAERLLYAK